MSKRLAITTLREKGAVAAHPLDRHVTIVKNKPVKVNLANPLYMDKKELRPGDLIAIVDMDEEVAYLCRVGRVGTALLSRNTVLELSSSRKVDLS